MAPTKETYIYLCNCENLCDLNEVEELLKAVEKKLVVKTSFKIVKGYFSGGQISDMVNETIPNLKMDYAVFVVHAGECASLSAKTVVMERFMRLSRSEQALVGYKFTLNKVMECGIPNSSSYSSCVVSKNLCRVILPVQDSQKYFTTLKNIDVLYNQ